MDAFTGKATAYAKARPGYAPAALDFILGLMPAGTVFADIGAGTGKFTCLLAQRAKFVYAIEPNEDMRTQIEARENICVMDGTAEYTGLPDKSVDAVTCAQAFHWFDVEKFKLECRRILKPGGRVFALYNNPVGDYRHDELVWHNKGEPHASWLEREERLQDFFEGSMTRRAFPNDMYYDAESWMAYMLSHSTSPRPGDEIYGRFVEGVRLIFERKSINGKLHLSFETAVYA